MDFQYETNPPHPLHSNIYSSLWANAWFKNKSNCVYPKKPLNENDNKNMDYISAINTLH